ncbi:MAG: PilZ domain-containing protein [Candidatus Omnitrophota bacterium]
MQEKRKYRRLEESVVVKHKMQESGNKGSSPGKNISAGGVRLTTVHDIHVGTKLELELNIPNNFRPFYALGEVIWVKKITVEKEERYDIGIKFTKLVSRSELKDF